MNRSSMPVIASIGLAMIATHFGSPRVEAGGPESVRFNRDVRPILASACFGCHGQGKQKAGLRLDLAESA